MQKEDMQKPLEEKRTPKEEHTMGKKVKEVIGKVTNGCTEIRKEWHHVQWPGRQEALHNLATVVAISAVMITLITAVDTAMSSIVGLIFG